MADSDLVLWAVTHARPQSLGALGAPGSEAWAAAAAAALSGDQGGSEFIMTVPFVLFRNATPGQGSADDDDAFFGVTCMAARLQKLPNPVMTPPPGAPRFLKTLALASATS